MILELDTVQEVEVIIGGRRVAVLTLTPADRPMRAADPSAVMSLKVSGEPGTRVLGARWDSGALMLEADDWTLMLSRE